VSTDCRRFLWKPSMNATRGWGGRDDGSEQEEDSGVTVDDHKSRSHHGSWKHGSRKHEGRSEGENSNGGGFGRHHGSSKHGSSKKHGSWKGSKKHGGGWREENSRNHMAVLTLHQHCSENINGFCSGFDLGAYNPEGPSSSPNPTYVHDVKQCLARQYASLNTDCAEYLISADSSSSYQGRHHIRIGKIVMIAVVAVVVLAFLCCMRRRCKHRRMLWRQMQQNMAPRVPGDTRYIAVPTTALPFSVPTAPSGSPQPQQHIITTTASPPYNPQGGIVYSPSPYTGGIPMNALPVAYNPQAMSIA